jgi:hypothetical protein
MGITGLGALREVLAADAFFRHLEAQEPAFLVAASGDLGTTTASCEGGSSTTGESVTRQWKEISLGPRYHWKKKQKVKHSVQVDRKKSICKN